MEEKFSPVLRFLVVSDVHYEDEPGVEKERMELALKTAYKYADGHESYNKLDALVVVGDFATSGSEKQMRAFKKTCDENLRQDETKTILTISSHEFKSPDGEEGGFKRLKEIFGKDPVTHEIINGFHFLALSTTRGTQFDDFHKEWLQNGLEQAAKDDPEKPIFVFQHPHIQSTVYGSILWGEDGLIPVMMNYPQIIDFSGHSHAPINDPRSIHQKYFTCLGTGTLKYFELDEFDKIYGTVPPNSDKAAQMLIVEADEKNRVRIYPYDLISENFFPIIHRIDKAYDPSSFIYTDEKRFSNPVKPYFEENAKIVIDDIGDNGCKIKFDQAKIEKEYVNYYQIVLKYKKNGYIAKCFTVWSEYYFYDMPSKLSCDIDCLKADTEYNMEITAFGFWNNKSENTLSVDFKTK